MERQASMERICGLIPDCYTKALMDVVDLFERHSIAFKHERIYNHKNIHALLAACVECRKTLHDFGGHAEVVRESDGKKPKFTLKAPF